MIDNAFIVQLTFPTILSLGATVSVAVQSLAEEWFVEFWLYSTRTNDSGHWKGIFQLSNV